MLVRAQLCVCVCVCVCCVLCEGASEHQQHVRVLARLYGDLCVSYSLDGDLCVSR